MKRSEKNKINHLSIVFSGMSSVSLGWGIRGMERGVGKGPNLPRSPLLDPLVSFSRKMAEGHGGDSRERTEHGDDKPQVIKGLVHMGPRGAARAFHRTVLGNGAHRAFSWAA